MNSFQKMSDNLNEILNLSKLMTEKIYTESEVNKEMTRIRDKDLKDLKEKLEDATMKVTQTEAEIIQLKNEIHSLSESLSNARRLAIEKEDYIKLMEERLKYLEKKSTKQEKETKKSKSNPDGATSHPISSSVEKKMYTSQLTNCIICADYEPSKHGVNMKGVCFLETCEWIARLPVEDKVAIPSHHNICEFSLKKNCDHKQCPLKATNKNKCRVCSRRFTLCSLHTEENNKEIKIRKRLWENAGIIIDFSNI